jgi:ADP-heptose:LPS heptosyltransferase
MPSDRALLVAAGGGIGDTLLAGVVAQALHARFAHVDALVLPAHRTVAEHDPAIDRVHVLASLVPTAEDLRAFGYAAAIVTWATFATAFVPVLAQIPVRVGQARRLYSPLFTKRVTVRSELGDHTTHWTQILLDYARAIDCDDPAARPVFAVTAADRHAADAVLGERGIGASFALLHPTRGLSAERARWPAAGFIALARALRERDATPLLVTGTAADAPVADAIARGADAISIAGATSIGTYAALAERAQYVVAIDSGPMHVAAAVGAPTVGIFALQSDEPDRWAPLGPHTAVVRAVYPCPPEHRKETCPDFACVRHLDTAAIVGTLDGLLAPITERRLT